MSWLILATLVAVAGTEPAAPAERAQAVEIKASLVLKVFQPEEATVAIVGEAERLGGFFLQRSPARLVLRVPTAQITELIAAAEKRGVVLDRGYTSRSIENELQQLTAQRRSHKELLEQYMAVLAGANAASVVTVQHAITNLIATIENIEGRLRMLENRAALAELVIDFQFRRREPPKPVGSSSFPWLNTLGLERLVGDFAP